MFKTSVLATQVVYGTTNAKVMGSNSQWYVIYLMNKCNWEKSTTDDANLFSVYLCGWIGCISSELLNILHLPYTVHGPDLLMLAKSA